MRGWIRRMVAKRRWKREVRDAANAKVDEAYRRLMRGDWD